MSRGSPSSRTVTPSRTRTETPCQRDDAQRDGKAPRIRGLRPITSEEEFLESFLSSMDHAPAICARCRKAASTTCFGCIRREVDRVAAKTEARVRAEYEGIEAVNGRFVRRPDGRRACTGDREGGPRSAGPRDHSKPATDAGEELEAGGRGDLRSTWL